MTVIYMELDILKYNRYIYATTHTYNIFSVVNYCSIHRDIIVIGNEQVKWH